MQVFVPETSPIKAFNLPSTFLNVQPKRPHKRTLAFMDWQKEFPIDDNKPGFRAQCGARTGRMTMEERGGWRERGTPHGRLSAQGTDQNSAAQRGGRG